MERLAKRYYSLAVSNDEKVADVYIYGDIVSWRWYENDVSSFSLAKEIAGLNVDEINIYINSYGGEVAEGLAIYNQLKRHHKAKIRTYVDGFACSVASVVFMAGDERIMSNSSLLMIHNAWLLTAGDHNDLRKDADDLETINRASINAYMEHINITEDELKKMMDEETWIEPMKALEIGFATAIYNDPSNQKAANQSIKQRIMQTLLSKGKHEINTPSQLTETTKKLIQEMVEQYLSTIQMNTSQELQPPKPTSEPELKGKGLFNFMAALATKLQEGADLN